MKFHKNLMVALGTAALVAGTLSLAPIATAQDSSADNTGTMACGLNCTQQTNWPPIAPPPPPPPPPIGYQGVYATIGVPVTAGCGGLTVPGPTPAQAAAVYPTSAQVPTYYISGPRTIRACCHEFSGRFCVEPDIQITVNQYNLTSINTV